VSPLVTHLSNVSPSVALIDWHAYSGTAALSLSLVLFALGIGLVFLGTRATEGARFGMPGRAAKVVTVLVWAVSIFVVLGLFKEVAVRTGESSLGFGPVLPITLASALCAFVAIAYMTRGGGTLAALGDGFAGAVAGPMVFELPFVLIITPVVTTEIPHPLLLFTVFLVVILTTLALPFFSSRFSVTRYSLYLLGGMVVVFAAWALLTGYAPPSDPVSFGLNAVSKVLGFASVVAGFVDSGHGRLAGGSDSGARAARSVRE
jgi:hypothetical protein